MKKQEFKKRRLAILLSAVLVVGLAAVIAFQPVEGIPTWKRVFQLFGVSDTVKEADQFDMAVHFIDVGKADGIYIRCNGKNILIDSGDASATGVVANYLKRQGVESIDLAVATHPDKDHIGGMATVLLEFPVTNFWMSRVPAEFAPDSTAYETMLFALSNQQIAVAYPQPGESVKIGDLDITVFGPQKQYDDTNDNSIVMRISYGEVSFLFMGDAEESAEKDILAQGYDLSASVLKVGHHGSKTSTSQELLDAVKPEAAVISVGEDKNELPKAAVIDRLTENNIKILRTDLNGNIVLATNGDSIHIYTEKDED